MSKSFFNLYNNIEFFEESDTDNEEKDTNIESSENTDTMPDSLDNDSDNNKTNNLNENNSSDNNQNEDQSQKSNNSYLNDLFNINDNKNEDKNEDNTEDNIDTPIEDEDEIDDDNLNDDDYNDKSKQENNDMAEGDEDDEDQLSNEDLNSILDTQFQLLEKDDVIDDERYIPPNSKLNYLDEPEKDDNLIDLEMKDFDDKDNLFTQGGALGQSALDEIGQMEQEGDELADLILQVPVDLITTLIDVIIGLIKGTLEGPINTLHEILAPIRTALTKLYNLVQPIVLLINNLIGIPFALGGMAWSTFCNTLRLFDIDVTCSTKYKPNDFLLDYFDAYTSMNPWRFKDIIYDDAYREVFIKAIKNYVKLTIDSFFLILKVIEIIVKIIEFLIVGIQRTIEIMIDVTTENNIKGFIIICGTLGMFYICLFGLTSVINYYNIFKEKFFPS